MVTAQRVDGETTEVTSGYIKSGVSITLGIFLLFLIPQYYYDGGYVLFMSVCVIICGGLGIFTAYAEWDTQRIRAADRRDMLR